MKRKILTILFERGYEHREEKFRLSSGEWSHDYVDVKRALSDGIGLRAAGEALIQLASSKGLEFDSVGGLTMGADALAHSVALISGVRWFSVRKEAKSHGRQKLIEGSEIASGERVFLVDDVVTTGASIIKALEALEPIGAKVVLASSLLDRGNQAAGVLERKGVDYTPLLTYKDMNIQPVGG